MALEQNGAAGVLARRGNEDSMKRKGLIALLVLALLFTLAGCGKDKKQTGGDGAEETPNQTETRTDRDAGAQTAPEDGQSGEVDSGEAELPVQSGTDGAGDNGAGDNDAGDNDASEVDSGEEDPAAGGSTQGENPDPPYDPNQPIELPPVPLN